MSKILYGVAGEGSGHSSRARTIITYLEKRGHEVKVITYSKGYKNLKPYFDVEKIFGLHIFYKKNQVQFLTTVFKNLAKTHEANKSVRKVLKIIKKFEPDMVFSDFEPISSFAASLKKLPLISIDNQHRLTNFKIEYPKKYQQEAVAAKTVTNLMLLNPKAYLVTSFFKAKITRKKTYIFPPILKQDILKLKTKAKDFVLVYLTCEFKEMVPILKKINKKFVIYGFNKDKEVGNLTFKKASHTTFVQDLANCQGIIANAGFTLMTESLYLKKPLLAVPVKGQFEQVLNAYYLEKLGYGKYWDEINREKIEAFLYNIKTYQKKLGEYKRENNFQLFKKIDSLIKMYS